MLTQSLTRLTEVEVVGRYANTIVVVVMEQLAVALFSIVAQAVVVIMMKP